LLGNSRNNEFAAQRRDRYYALIGKHISTTEAEFSVRVGAEAIHDSGKIHSQFSTSQ
jgi:hypothetical protein